MEEALKDAIETVVDDRYEETDGSGTIRVELIRQRVEGRMDRPVTRNEVEVACDELVAEDRLVFLRDHGRDGRRYCSRKVPEATVELLREPYE
jgi:hypothetical protein